MTLIDSRHLKNAPAALASPGAGNGGASSDATPTLPPAPRFTFLEWRALARDMMKDRAYVATPLGPTVVEYLAWKRLSSAAEKTLDQYERDLRLVALAHAKPVEAITHNDLALVLETVPPKSWRRCRSAWSDFFRWAVADGRRPDNPVDRLPRMRRPPAPVYDEIYTQDELDLLVAGTTTLAHALLERVRVLTMIESGGRASELTGIRLSDFDLVRYTVTVTGKGDKTRIVPISPELARLVNEHFLMPPAEYGRDPVPADYLWFPTRRDRAGTLTMYPERELGYGSFHRWWVKVVAAAGVRYLNPHMTRHGFATDLVDATDGDVYAVKELLGHESIRTSETYLHSSKTRRRAAVDRLQAYRASRRSEVGEGA